jgi:hypothetical protein
MSKKEKIQIWITAGLIIVFIVLTVRTLGQRKTRQTPVTQPAILANVEETESSRILFPALEKEADSLEIDRDPFVKVEHPKTADGPDTVLTLEGIMEDKDQRVAVINEMIVQAGDTIAGHKVLDIQSDKVVLSDGYRLLELRLYLNDQLEK